jgi:serine phosphatase RsbU (regulator of sigma subunit)
LQQLGPRDPAALIGEVNRGVKSMLGQIESGAAESNDGMDAAFLWFDNASRRLHFAGAKLALYQLDPDQQAVQTVDGERMGVGYVDTPLDHSWTNKTIAIAEGSLLFLTTDGLIDQIGGSKEIAYGKRRMRDVLLAQRTQCARHVSQAMLDDYQAWQGEQPRRDDLTFFCFRP